MRTIRLPGLPALVIGAGAALLSYQAMAQIAATTPVSVPADATLEQQPAQRLSQTLLAETAQLPANALTEDYEAAMMFVIGQQAYTAPIVQNALDILAAQSGMPQGFRAAVGRVRLAVMRRNFQGTAALAGGTEAAIMPTGITFPIIGINNGSSNYGE